MITDYLKYEKSLAFIKECAEENVVIIGIERVELRDGKTHPDLLGIADYSSLKKCDSKKSIELANRFLDQYGTDKYEHFEFVTL